MPERKDAIIKTRVSKSFKKQLRRVAAQRDLTMSALVREAYRIMVRRHESESTKEAAA